MRTGKGFGRYAAGCALLTLFAGMAPAAPPAGYYDSTNGLAGQALKDALHEIIKGHTVFPYDSSGLDVYDILENLDEDPLNPANVLLTYKGVSVEKSTRPDWNREHTWPQSMGADVSPMVSDLHHIRAEDSSLNSSRNNSAYNVVPSPTNSGYGNRWTGSEFEPRDAVKGDIARGILYMDVRYDGTGPGNEAGRDLTLVDTTDTTYGQMGKKSVLLEWALSDLPDAAEMLRNDKIYLSYQQNRNPFIDRPEFVELIYGPVHDNDTLTIDSDDRLTSPVLADSVNVPVLSVGLTASPHEWELGAVTLSRTGTLPGSAFSAVSLYRDMNGNGVIEPGDPLFATGTFGAAETSLTLTLSRPTRITSAPASLLVTASVSPAATDGGTFQFQVTGLVSSATGGIDPSYPGLALASSPTAILNNLSPPGVKIVQVSTRASAGGVLAGGATAGNAEFIVLANQSGAAVNLSGWQLRKLAGSNVLNLSGTIPNNAHFLIASNSYASAANVEGSTADQFTATASLLGGLADTSPTSLGLYDNTGTKQDGFSWSGGAGTDTTAPYFRDDPALTTGPSPTATVAATQVIARKRAWGGATGPYRDTDSNAADLEVRTIGSPKPPPSSEVGLPVALSGFEVE